MFRVLFANDGRPAEGCQAQRCEILSRVFSQSRVIVAGAALVGAVTIALWARQATDFAQIGDPAVIESYTWMASRGALTLGPYSRFQWHHPGPLYFFWMAPFYLLSGSRPAGLNAGALVLNLAALAVVTMVVARRAASDLGIAVTALVALFAWRVMPIFTSAWNPHVAVFALIALIIATAEVVAGATSMLPAVAALASLIGQSHVGLLPPAIVLGGIAAVAAVVRWQNGRALIATAIVLLLVWLPTIIEQLTGRPGNVSQLWTFFVKESHRGQRFPVALSTWSSMLNGVLWPDFSIAVGSRVRPGPRWVQPAAFAQVLGLAVACVLALRSRRRFEGALAGLLLCVSILALWSATRIDGAIFDHEVFWMSAVGVLNLAVVVAVIGWPLAQRVVAGFETRSQAVAICWGLCALCAAMGMVSMRSAVAGSANISSESQTVSDVAGELRTYFTREGIMRPLIRIDQDAWPLAAGVIVQLQKSGVPVAVEDDWVPMFTPAFAATGQEPVELALNGKAEHVRRRDKPGETVVFEHDPQLYVHRTK